MNALQAYLKTTVDPAFQDFQDNPASARHAYLACVAAYHAIDRVTYPKKPSNLRRSWRLKSLEFRIVDMVAHKFKHVVSDDEKEPKEAGKISLPALVFGKGVLNTYTFNTTAFNQGGIELHNLRYVIRDAIEFLRQEALTLPGDTEE